LFTPETNVQDEYKTSQRNIGWMLPRGQQASK